MQITDTHLKKFTPEFVGLAFNFEVNPSSCGNPGYFSEYIRFCALQDNQSGKSTTHILLDRKEENIVGFVSLKATTLLTEIDVDDKKIWTGEPALEISELAVHKNFERQGVGSALIDLSIAFATKENETTLGIRHLVLAADPQAVSFYQHKGFSLLRDYFLIPMDGTNSNCVSMFMQLH